MQVQAVTTNLMDQWSKVNLKEKDTCLCVFVRLDLKCSCNLFAMQADVPPSHQYPPVPTLPSGSNNCII